MKLVSWNVNGLRAVLKKDFLKQLKKLDADVVCIQETKLQADTIPNEMSELNCKWNFAIKKGYSGTLCIVKKEPISVSFGIDSKEHDEEGRCIVLEYDDFYIVNAYVPNSQPKLKRLDFRERWEEKLLKLLKKLDKKKPLIYCGDLNVAHEEIDLKNPNSNHENPGFSDSERNMMTKLLNSGFVDVYRNLNPEGREYTWWSYRFNAREKDIGWRIDYFIVSERLLKNIKSMTIHKEIEGSDHCPIEIEI